MGGSGFSTVVHGKNAEEAFSSARDDAKWEHGHGGYTGTIAEKHEYRLFQAPDGVSSQDLEAMVWSQCTFVEVEISREEWLKPHPGVGLRSRGDKYYRVETKPMPDQHEALVARMQAVAHDKWGPCVGVELSGAELAEARERYAKNRGRLIEHDRSGKVVKTTFTDPEPDQVRFFRFFGIASD